MVSKCKYGHRCYRRKNEAHMKKYYHDNVADTKEVSNDEGVEPDTISPSEKRARTDSPGDMKSKMDEVFFVKHPAELLEFWNHAKEISDGEDPRDSFKSLDCLRLVGVFDFLAGDLKHGEATDIDGCLVHSRHDTDLPEMQTIAEYKTGRYAYWRDTPDSINPLIVHVESGLVNFPKLQIIGVSDPMFIIAHRVGKKPTKEHHRFLEADWISNFDAYCGKVKTLIATRRKESLGEPFHGLGISVKIKNDIGYRPVTDNPASLKKNIETVAKETDETIKSKNMEHIMEIMSFVQFANDELDFGMGLEFGHDLFMSNFKEFDGMAVNVLTNAYTLLNRTAFARILKAHSGVRRAEYKQI